jgi:DNA polymerase-3 subunit epsilon
MKGRVKLAIWAATLFAVGVAVPVATGVTVFAALAPTEQATLSRILSERAPLFVFGALVLLALCVVLARWLYAEYVGPIAHLTEQTRLVLTVDHGKRVTSEGAAEWARLADVIDRLAEDRRSMRADLDVRARESQIRLEEERNRLAALMSELAEGVMVCNTEGRILLYNEQVRALFAPAGQGAPEALVGLGRSVFSLVDRDQFMHALDKLERGLQRAESAPITRFVLPAGGGRLVRFNAAPYLSGGHIAGIVFTLNDVTGALDRDSRLLFLCDTLSVRMRGPVANIFAAAENLARYPDMDVDSRRKFVDIVAVESELLSRAIHEAAGAYGDALKASLSLEDMWAGDLLVVAQRTLSFAQGLEVNIEDVDAEAWLKVDSYSFVQALGFLVGRLKDDYHVRRVRLSARKRERFAEVDLGWDAAILAHDALTLWEDEPMNVGPQGTGLTLRDVLEKHGAEAWVHTEGPAGQRASRVRFLFRAGEPAVARPVPARGVESRPEYYDFDLFAHRPSRDVEGNSLEALAYTVFDTETTGLEPSAGDEIISIGAVRIVNGRLLKNETFERMVDPQRPLSPASIRVHGIDPASLNGQPKIGEVLPVFHRFCEDTILVAHNAAFDMRFLELKQAATGVRFEHPVLDTLLLSAVVHPHLEDHRLEAIAERLGVSVIGRHTALGDALVTGEVFLRLLKLLAERGVVTLGEALEASRRTYYARLQY